MFHFRLLNNEINNVHEKALSIVYSDYKSTFQELLDKDVSFSAHHRITQTLAIQSISIFKVFTSNYCGSFQN